MSTSDTDYLTGPAGPGDLEAIKRLLSDAGLPIEGVDALIDGFLVVRRAGQADPVVVAAGAIERCGREGLLRSVVVHPDARGRGLGRMVADALIDTARAEGIDALYLLTNTAESFFKQAGFETIQREAAPESIRGTGEFRTLCPESAVLMRLNPVERSFPTS